MTIEVKEGQRIVYQTDGQGIYVGEAVADPDPQNIGNWLIPAGCVEVRPPLFTGSKIAKWVGYKWKLINP